MEQKEYEITKAEFRALYFQYATPNSGWTEEYWDKFFETKNDQQYFVYHSEDKEATRMFIRAEGNKHCIFFSYRRSRRIVF